MAWFGRVLPFLPHIRIALPTYRRAHNACQRLPGTWLVVTPALLPVTRQHTCMPARPVLPHCGLCFPTPTTTTTTYAYPQTNQRCSRNYGAPRAPTAAACLWMIICTPPATSTPAAPPHRGTSFIRRFTRNALRCHIHYARYLSPLPRAALRTYLAILPTARRACWTHCIPGLILDSLPDTCLRALPVLPPHARRCRASYLATWVGWGTDLKTDGVLVVSMIRHLSARSAHCAHASLRARYRLRYGNATVW